MELLFCILVAFLIGIQVGWVMAHCAVAEECEKLGRFFVKGKIYYCHKIRTFEKNKAQANEHDQ